MFQDRAWPIVDTCGSSLLSLMHSYGAQRVASLTEVSIRKLLPNAVRSECVQLPAARGQLPHRA